MDIADERLLSLICCIALIYLKVSGPYWKLVNSDVKYSDFSGYVQQMLAFLKTCKDDPAFLLEPTVKSAFDNTMMISSQCWDAVHDFAKQCDMSFISPVIDFVVTEAIVVTERQLCDFLPKENANHASCDARALAGRGGPGARHSESTTSRGGEAKSKLLKSEGSPGGLIPPSHGAGRNVSVADLLG
ncbi:hypothetical protein RRG08_010709 [Elysia crispata]|uniref:Uncharacterized protein n=1 Tax=Elysia crispata TaxID=231223 RepID=A0AAE1E825_9GAST|nr:hypothetical protein RRG08_010709 [Elysia crispata]